MDFDILEDLKRQRELIEKIRRQQRELNETVAQLEELTGRLEKKVSTDDVQEPEITLEESTVESEITEPGDSEEDSVDFEDYVKDHQETIQDMIKAGEFNEKDLKELKDYGVDVGSATGFDPPKEEEEPAAVPATIEDNPNETIENGEVKEIDEVIDTIETTEQNKIIDLDGKTDSEEISEADEPADSDKDEIIEDLKRRLRGR